MLTQKLVRLIEAHSETLAESLLHKVQRSEFTRAYAQVPVEELKHRVHDIYLHLGEWLISKSDGDIDRYYSQTGMRRAEQGVPLSQVIWSIILIEDNLWEFILNETTPDRPVELFCQQELLQLLEHFFNRAIHAVAMGYEQAGEQTARVNTNVSPAKHTVPSHGAEPRIHAKA
jgi:hypothetical protein